LAPAVPDVQTSTVGRPLALATPSAKKLADRSSKIGIVFTSGCRANAIVSGVDRDPGEITAEASPNRTSVSTKTEAHSVLVFLKSSIHYRHWHLYTVPDFEAFSGGC
jgi:hypothetical protein